MNRLSALPFGLLCLLLLTATPLRAEVSASVDRTEVAMDESFTLTITVSELRVFSQPDLSPLDADFHVLGTSQNSNTSIVNGKLSSSTSWTVQLMPKRAGNTSIPPITVGKEKTDTVEIVVDRQNRGATAGANEEVLLEAELSDNTVYVTAQVLLTLRVSMAQAARFKLEEPELDQAIVQQIAEASYQQVRGGRRFQVTEYTFAIFPSTPGELVIQPLNLVAELVSSRPRSMFDPMLGQSKRVLRRTEPLTINVIPAPDEISPADWLPARKVRLSDQWSTDIDKLQVGDSVTRTIELQAKGVMASQLPPLFLPQVEGLKFYPDQPVVSDDHSALGVTGKRVERIALVATRPGRYELPAQRVVWWDVARNEQQTAILPAISFEVAPSAQPVAPSTPQLAEPTTATSPQTDSGSLEAARPWYLFQQWWWISALLLITCLALAVLYLRARQQLLQAPVDAPSPSGAKTSDTEPQAYNALRTACQTGDAAASYQALQGWCRQYWNMSVLPGFEQLKSVGAGTELIDQAVGLQQHLYGNQAATAWDAGSLLRAVDQQRASGRDRGHGETSLPPLYG